MLVYRLAKETFITDLHGTGGLYGEGRWHEIGTRILYTAETFSLAKLETLANSAFIPKNYAVVCIEVPDDVSIKDLAESDLPANWTDTPAPKELKEIALNWIRKNEHLVLRVPSVHSPYERNCLINPLHPDHGRLRIVEHKSHPFDKRLKPEEEVKPKPKKKAAKSDPADMVLTLKSASGESGEVRKALIEFKVHKPSGKQS